MENYTLYDENEYGIYHIYKINIINDNYFDYLFNPEAICNHKDAFIRASEIKSNIYTEIDIIQKIKNILDDIENDVRICENCIREIIAQKQDIIFDTESEGYIK